MSKTHFQFIDRIITIPNVFKNSNFHLHLFHLNEKLRALVSEKFFKSNLIFQFSDTINAIGPNITPRLQCIRCSTFMQVPQKALSIQRFIMKKCNLPNHTSEPVTHRGGQSGLLFQFLNGSLIISFSLFLQHLTSLLRFCL